MNNNMDINHTINLSKRNDLNVTGVKKIDHFDSNEFLIDTNMGYLNIKGKELELIKFDTIKEDINIKGKIDSLIYKEKNMAKEDSIFNRLFK